MTKKVCSFPGCFSGSSKDKRKNKQLGLRNKTLFKVPKKNSPLRQQWQTSLDIELSDTDVLCERHFREIDIIRIDEIMLANGVRYKSPRDIIKLAPNTIPIRVLNNNEEIIGIRTDPVDHEISQGNCKEVNNRNSEAYPEKDSENVTISRGIAEDVIISNELEESIEETGAESVLIPDIISPEATEELSSAQKTIADTSESDGLECIKEKLPAGWHVDKRFNTIDLSHINPETLEIKKRIKILPDMTMQVIINNTVTSVKNLLPIQSIDDLCKNVLIVHNLLLCCGVGIENMRSNNCLTVVEPSSHNMFNRIRCFECKEVRKKIVNNLYMQKKLTARIKTTDKILKQLLKCYEQENNKLRCNI